MKKFGPSFAVLLFAAFGAWAAANPSATPTSPVMDHPGIQAQSGNCPTLFIVNSPSGCAIVISKSPSPNCQRTRYSQGTVVTIGARPNTGLGYSVITNGGGCDSFVDNIDGTYTCVVTVTSPSTSQTVTFSCS